MEKAFNERGDRYGNRLHLFYIWGHTYEFDTDDNWGMIEDFCAEIAGNPRTWYATNIEILDYLAALRQLRFSVDYSVVYTIPAWLTANGKLVEVAAGQTMPV